LTPLVPLSPVVRADEVIVAPRRADRFWKRLLVRKERK
jgi:hypothetical protein